MRKGKTKMRDRRLQRGWTQQQVGFFTNMSAADVSRIETRRMRPYPLQAWKLGHLFGLKPEELQELTKPTKMIPEKVTTSLLDKSSELSCGSGSSANRQLAGGDQKLENTTGSKR